MTFFTRWGWGLQKAGFGGGGSLPFSQQVISLFGANLIGYWQLNETSGTTATDSSPEGNNGTYTGVDLANHALPSAVGGKAPYFDSVNDDVNIYSAGLASDFSVSAGSMIVLAKVYNSGVWTDNTVRCIFKVGVNDNNFVAFIKQADANGNDVRCNYRAGGTSKLVDIDTTTTGWAMYGITWNTSADEVKVYFNGAQSGSTQTSLGTWAGSLASGQCYIGRYNTAPYRWYGYIGHAILLKKTATPTEMLTVAQYAGLA